MLVLYIICIRSTVNTLPFVQPDEEQGDIVKIMRGNYMKSFERARIYENIHCNLTTTLVCQCKHRTTQTYPVQHSRTRVELMLLPLLSPQHTIRYEEFTYLFSSFYVKCKFHFFKLNINPLLSLFYQKWEPTSRCLYHRHKTDSICLVQLLASDDD